MKSKNLKNIKAENQRNRQSERLKNDITRRLLNYLERKYEMRFNTALGCTETRKAGSNEPFVPVDERMRNTIAIKARLDGIDAWDKDIRRYTTRVRDKKRLEKVGNLVKNSYLYR